MGKKFKDDFEGLLKELDDLGYNSYWQVLNAKDYGVPQNRERVFVVSIRKDVDNGKFMFPIKINNQCTLLDYLQDEGSVHKKHYLNKHEITRILNTNFKKDIYKNSTVEICKSLLTNTCNIDFLVCDYRYDEGLRIRKNNISPCLTTKCISKSLSGKPLVIINGSMRELTPLEVFLLMGFEKEDFNKMKNTKIGQNQIAKQAGNSIVVNVIEEIYKILFKDYIKQL